MCSVHDHIILCATPKHSVFACLQGKRLNMMQACLLLLGLVAHSIAIPTFSYIECQEACLKGVLLTSCPQCSELSDVFAISTLTTMSINMMISQCFQIRKQVTVCRNTYATWWHKKKTQINVLHRGLHICNIKVNRSGAIMGFFSLPPTPTPLSPPSLGLLHIGLFRVIGKAYHCFAVLCMDFSPIVELTST